MVCKFCGKGVTNQSIFCLACGKKIVLTDSSVDKVPESTHSVLSGDTAAPLEDPSITGSDTDIIESINTRELKDRYAFLFANSHDIILYIRHSDGQIVEANEAAVKEYGFSHGELLGMTIFDLRKQDSVRLVKEQLNQANEHSILLEGYHFRKDGSAFPIEASSQVTTMKGDRIFLSIIRNITERKQTEKEILHQVKSQAILLKILRQFSCVVAEDIDDVINTTLRIIGEFDENDRSYIFELSVDGLTVNNTHEWCSEGIQSQIASLQNLPVDTFPWWMDKLRRFENINVPLADDLPPEAQLEKEILQAQAIQSLLAVPITYEGNLIGFLGFDSVKKRKNWSEMNTYTLELVAQIIATALQRKKYVMSIRESENYYRAIFENTGAATLIIDKDLTITNVNEEGQKLLGYTREELIGKKWTDFIPDSKVATMQEYHNKRLLNLVAVPLKYQTQLVDRHGNYRDGLVAVDIISGTNRSVVNFIDFTEFNRLDRALKALSGVNMAMVQAEREEDLVRNVCQKLVETTGYSLAWAGFLQEDQQQTVKIIASAGKEDGYLAKLNISLQDPVRGNGPAATAIRTGQQVILQDFRKDDSIRPWLTDALRHGFKSGMAIPLMADNKAFGVLCVYSGETDRFDSEEEILILEMANDLAYATMSLRNRTEKMQTAEELKKSLTQMRHILMQFVTSLGNTTDIRDPYTAGHQRKVALLAAAIAAEMGLSKDQIEGISVMGNLHDVGKIYVPIEILNRSGKLSEIEFALIKAHSQAGYDIVRDIEFPWPVAAVILQHHERMDGSGYPRGLTGEDILVEARILGVADVVEAMASHRPYRPALGIEIAMEEISQNSGILYDPAVVNACLKLLREKNFIFE